MNFFLSDRVRGLKPSVTMALDNQAREMMSAGKEIFKWTAGEPDFLPPQGARETMAQAVMEGNNKYTAAKGIPDLIKVIAENFAHDQHLNYKPAQIVVTNGAKEAISLALACSVNRGDKVAIIKPYWVSFSDIVSFYGGVPCFWDINHLKKINNFLDEYQPKIIILNSPNNPTSSVFSQEQWNFIKQALEKRHILVISDEIYSHLTYQGIEHQSIAQICPELRDRTLIVNGVSKSDAMQGYRIGWVAGPEDIIKKIADLKSQISGCPCSISQIGALTALQNTGPERKEMRTAYEKRWQNIILPLAKKMKLQYFTPQAAFYFFFQIPAQFKGNCLRFCERLLNDAGIAITPGSAFGYPGWARLCFAAPDQELEVGLLKLEKFLNK